MFNTKRKIKEGVVAYSNTFRDNPPSHNTGTLPAEPAIFLQKECFERVK
jgi:hypothetical protein